MTLQSFPKLKKSVEIVYQLKFYWDKFSVTSGMVPFCKTGCLNRKHEFPKYLIGRMVDRTLFIPHFDSRCHIHLVYGYKTK